MRFVNGSTNTYPTPEVEVKVVLLGHYFCGKTSLLERFLTDRFIGENRYQNTIGASYGAKKVTLNDKQPLLLGVWDTAGSERYESMSRMYYRAAKAAVVCYDVTDEESWNKAKFWVDELKRNEDSCKIYIVGTKLDLLNSNPNNKKIDFHNVLDYSEDMSENGTYFIRACETSAKSGKNVEKLFLDIAQDYLDDSRNNLTEFNKALQNKTESQRRNNMCCVIL